MSNATYTPTPVDTSGVTLPEGLGDLVEKLAEHNHEIWSQGRIKDGWTYGSERNDTLKHHPCLIPYSDLPESEREYDRNTAVEAIKLVQTLGYTITKCD